MFKKNKCRKCGESLNGRFKFCPSCGYRADKEEKNEGMLGSNDYVEEDVLNPIFGGFAGGMLGKMLGSTLRMLEKEMQKEFERAQRQPIRKTDFQLFINGKKVNPENIKIIRKDIPMDVRKRESAVKSKVSISKDKLQKMSSLPREEPSSSVRRFADQVIYEIDVPGVKSAGDVLINRLESSIEIKALAEDKVYSKILPINLPIRSYNLSDDKLVIELEGK
jgi:hypothetical protein